MNLWVFSTEPEVYPWSRVESAGTARWDGIRGTAARKWMRSLAAGDRILGYHSSPERAFVALATVLAPATPDPADPDWLAVDVRFDRWLDRRVPLSEARAEPGLAANKFLRMPRLSVSPVTEAEAALFSKLSRTVFRG
jgi:predicted RNA-binding protein with PUA-like domain